MGTEHVDVIRGWESKKHGQDIEGGRVQSFVEGENHKCFIGHAYLDVITDTMADLGLRHVQSITEGGIYCIVGFPLLFGRINPVHKPCSLGENACMWCCLTKT